MNRRVAVRVAALLVGLVALSWQPLRAEDGYDLWLRYQPISDPARMSEYRATLTELARLVDAGQIKPHVSTVLPLEEIRKGHELIAARHTAGKIVLQVVP